MATNPGFCTGGMDWRGDCTYSRRRIAKSWTRPSPSAAVGERRPHAPTASSRKVEGYGRRARSGEEAYGSAVSANVHTRARRCVSFGEPEENAEVQAEGVDLRRFRWTNSCTD